MRKGNKPFEAELSGDTVLVDLMYPRHEDNPKYVSIALYDVRAANDIRVSYDFDRDGWVIEREDSEEGPPLWVEVAFVQAWPKEEK